MLSALRTAAAATILSGLSLFVWREGYQYSDWAALALVPTALVILIGVWSLTLQPWRAKLHIALREDSPLGKLLTGKLRAHFVSGVFTFITITLLAWQALVASMAEASILVIAFFLSAVLFSAGQNVLVVHFHQPFARSIATFAGTWLVALPLIPVIAWITWRWGNMPGEILNAGINEAMFRGLGRLPDRGGWIGTILSIPSGYEAAKLWIVIQLKDYPIVGRLFSLDAALFAFVLCRSAVVIAHFVEQHVAKDGR